MTPARAPLDCLREREGLGALGIEGLRGWGRKGTGNREQGTVHVGKETGNGEQGTGLKRMGCMGLGRCGTGFQPVPVWLPRPEGARA